MKMVIGERHCDLPGYTGRNSVDVDGETLDARHILIATGATPVTLGIPGEEHLITNEEFLALEILPERIVMVGGGYIAAEFSHIAARAGALVTVLQRGEGRGGCEGRAPAAQRLHAKRLEPGHLCGG